MGDGVAVVEEMTQARPLEELVEERTGGRMRRLQVEKSCGRVLLRGRCDSYHVLQLALAAVMESLPGDCRSQIEFDVQVG
jgi:hypothetical protein